MQVLGSGYDELFLQTATFLDLGWNLHGINPHNTIYIKFGANLLLGFRMNNMIRYII
jgi:hypothetical protein